MVVGVFFGVLIGIAGIATLLLPARRYLKTSLTAIIRDEYEIKEYIEKNPSKGILKGNIKAEDEVTAPLSSKDCAFFRIKEKTRTYHSSGGSKKTTDKTYFCSGGPFLEAGEEKISIDLDDKTEIRLSNTLKEKARADGEIPGNLQKLREGKESYEKEDGDPETVGNPQDEES